MNDNQKLKYYRFLREDARTRLRINQAEYNFLEELEFWNGLSMTINKYDTNEARSLLTWVGDVLRTNYPNYHAD